MDKLYIGVIREILLAVANNSGKMKISNIFEEISNQKYTVKLRKKLGDKKASPLVRKFIHDLADYGCLTEQGKITKETLHDSLLEYSITTKGLFVIEELSNKAKVKKLVSKGLKSVAEILKFIGPYV